MTAHESAPESVRVPVETLRELDADTSKACDSWIAWFSPSSCDGQPFAPTREALREGLRVAFLAGARHVRESIIPAPAPEPPAELVAEWEREAMRVIPGVKFGSHDHARNAELVVAKREGYLARCRAEWARTQKGGGS